MHMVQNKFDPLLQAQRRSLTLQAMPDLENIGENRAEGLLRLEGGAVK